MDRGAERFSGRWPFRKHPLDDSTSRGVGQPRVSAENMGFCVNSLLLRSVEAHFSFIYCNSTEILTSHWEIVTFKLW